MRNREKYLQKQRGKHCFQVMDETRSLFLIILILLCWGERDFACSSQMHWNCQDAVESCRCCFPFFFPPGRTCVCILPKISPRAVSEGIMIKKVVLGGGDVTHPTSRGKGQKVLLPMIIQKGVLVCLFVCLFLWRIKWRNMEQLNPKGCVCVAAAGVAIRRQIHNNNSKSIPGEAGQPWGFDTKLL